MLSRRRVITSTAAAASLAWLAPAAAAIMSTPRQSEGPFYPRASDLSADRDNDLVRIAGAVKQAGGEILHLSGLVSDAKGNKIKNARVEIWQCDVNGRYLHAGDTRSTPPRDLAFQGFGHTVCDARGRWQFRTIKPTSYPGRTPHIHFKVILPGGKTLITQMYVADEPGNARDFLYQSVSPKQRKALSVVLTQQSNGTYTGFFPIVI